jgi:hypothetical protein
VRFESLPLGVLAKVLPEATFGRPALDPNHPARVRRAPDLRSNCGKPPTKIDFDYVEGS